MTAVHPGHTQRTASIWCIPGACTEAYQTGLHSTKNVTSMGPSPLSLLSTKLSFISNRLNHISHIKPGGYIEQAEIALHHLCDDGTLSADSVYSRWANFSKEWEAWKGISLLVTDTMKEAIIQAGFEDVVEKRFKIPIGPWSPDPRLKEIGWWYRHHWETGMEGWALAPAIRHLGVSCFPF